MRPRYSYKFSVFRHGSFLIACCHRRKVILSPNTPTPLPVPCHRCTAQYPDVQTSRTPSSRVIAVLPSHYFQQNLRSAGDEVLRIEGVLSAFLSYVFNRISPAPGSSVQPVAFSKACWEAAEQGLARQTPATQIITDAPSRHSPSICHILFGPLFWLQDIYRTSQDVGALFTQGLLVAYSRRNLHRPADRIKATHDKKWCVI